MITESFSCFMVSVAKIADCACPFVRLRRPQGRALRSSSPCCALRFRTSGGVLCVGPSRTRHPRASRRQAHGRVPASSRTPRDGEAIPYVSDYFDFSIYMDADEEVLRGWYIDRFFSLRNTAFRDPKSYFHRYATLSDAESRQTANRIWETINLVNLRENVAPNSHRADLILTYFAKDAAALLR